ALIWQAQRKGNLANFIEFLASFITLSFDSLVFLLCNCAQDKLHEVNTRLGDVDNVVPELRPLVLESAARQYELTADQVGALGTAGAMGVPLACNSVRHRVKLVTDSFVVYRSVENFGTQHAGTLAALCMNLANGASRIVAHSMAGDMLYQEVGVVSKRTLSVLGAVDASRWPEREILLVERILRNSKRGISLSMGGLATMDHGFLLSVIGSTITYLVVLVQYKDPALQSALNATAANASGALPP
ncbi:Gustatory receptor 103, partial [Frankliniella occidentalis]